MVLNSRQINEAMMVARCIGAPCAEMESVLEDMMKCGMTEVVVQSHSFYNIVLQYSMLYNHPTLKRGRGVCLNKEVIFNLMGNKAVDIQVMENKESQVNV